MNVNTKKIALGRAIGLIVCSCLFPLLAADQKPQAKDSLNGDWVGEMNFDGKQFRFLFHFEQSKSGRISGMFRAPDISPAPMPMEDVRLKGRNIYLSIKKMGSYRGKVSLKSGRMSGNWMGGDGNKLPLDLKRSKEKWTYDRPQTPKAPFSYQTREVEVPNKLGGNRLSGTLNLPKGRGPFPAVVLVSDFGPQDRDGTIHDHKPLAVIADYLAKKGIASLRYDDRGIGKSTGTYEFATTMDLATDAAAAFEFLKKQQAVDAGKVGIIGHGEGGVIAPIVAEKIKGVAFMVLLGAPGVRGDQMLLMQNEAIGRATGLSDEMLGLTRRFMSSVYKLLTQNPPDLKKAEKMSQEFEEKTKSLSPEESAKLMELGGQLEWQLALVKAQSPWLSWILAYDPGLVLEKIKTPVLVLNGEKDLQVLADINLPTIKRHLLAGGNRQIEVEKMRGLNHFFQKTETGLPGEYALIEQTFSTSALKQIAGWLIKTVGK